MHPSLAAASQCLDGLPRRQHTRVSNLPAKCEQYMFQQWQLVHFVSKTSIEGISSGKANIQRCGTNSIYDMLRYFGAWLTSRVCECAHNNECNNEVCNNEKQSYQPEHAVSGGPPHHTLHSPCTLSVWSTSAPASSSTSTARRWPFELAMYRGLCPDCKRSRSSEVAERQMSIP